jgi:DNA-directed RNA polymerase sigma subunit (sigma70/sigma32)
VSLKGLLRAVLASAWPLRQLCALVQGVEDEDLVCVAIDALVHAAGTFSAERGTRLLTYAWFCIMRDLTDALRLQVRESLGWPLGWLCGGLSGL